MGPPPPGGMVQQPPRTRIDPEQMPNPVSLIEISLFALACQKVLSRGKCHAIVGRGLR